MPLTSSALAPLKAALDRLYSDFNHADAASDPVHIVRRYDDPADREVVGFLAAGLAFGRVASVLASIERVLSVMGPSPAAFVRRFDPSRDGVPIEVMGHRWTRGRDIVALIWTLRSMLEGSGTLERAFVAGLEADAPDIRHALAAFCARACVVDLRPVYGRVPRVPGVRYFFPNPLGGSACKRLNLFLRWMVRRDAVDMGVWRAVRRIEADRPPRHARHPGREVPSTDAL